LDLARSTGQRLHFFASNRVLRAFPATAEAVLNEGHDLDWFCKHPDEISRTSELGPLLIQLGHEMAGMCVRAAWPAGIPSPAGMTFLSAAPGPCPPGLRLFPVETKSDRDAARNGISARAWTDTLKGQIRDAASRNRSLTVCLRPQVLAKYDPKLAHIRELVDLAKAVSLPIRTLRQAMSFADESA